MILKSIVTTTAAAALVALCATASSVPVRAQEGQAELIGLHQLCDRGDRKACVKFGMMLGRAQERHAEWRRVHPEWFFWER